MIVIYGHPLSGHSYKVRLYCALAGIANEYRFTDITKPRAARRADFIADSPYGEVPTIVDDGQRLAQSNAILMHLARKHGRFAGARDEWDRIVQWLCWEMNRIGLSLPNLRYHRAVAPGTVPGAVIDWLEARAVADLATLDAQLAKRDWLLPSGPTIADISNAGYSWWMRDAGLDPARWPAVDAWLARIRALPGWRHADELMAEAAP